MSLKRRVYGLPVLRLYREYRTTQLAARPEETPYGFRFAGNPVYLQEAWEPNEKSLVRRFLSSSDAFIDVGANHGFYSCLAASFGIPVAAIEPEAGNLRFLKNNVIFNSFDRVEIFPLAMSDGPGVLSLYGDGDTASLVPGWLGTDRYFRQSVPTNSMDNLFANRWDGKRLLIKIDVEGAEGAVLSGSAALINREPKPFWLIETFPNMLDGSGVSTAFMGVFEAFRNAGYAAFVVDSNMPPVSSDRVAAWAADPTLEGRGGSNFLFIDSAHAPT